MKRKHRTLTAVRLFSHIYTRGINVKLFYVKTVVSCRYKTLPVWIFLKLTCKQKENGTVEKVRRMFTVLSFNSNHNLKVQSQENQLRIL